MAKKQVVKRGKRNSDIAKKVLGAGFFDGIMDKIQNFLFKYNPLSMALKSSVKGYDQFEKRHILK